MTNKYSEQVPTLEKVEFLPAELSSSRLRREVISDELELYDGQIILPYTPGLGIELNREAL